MSDNPQAQEWPKTLVKRGERLGSSRPDHVWWHELPEDITAGSRCIGYGPLKGACDQVITVADLELNSTGLWCSRCERRRRRTISHEMHGIYADLKRTRHQEARDER